ncbi:exodeoxyribonuclease VII large subunit [Desmospora profundinema]|uniref:Exodeoxyribonuclease 7 large subunit n=1 Tax=Desmospora profundinema TaxID=1571184 RepID=A0ABU1IJD3_9BACL|nr:exodeoxyribonuclease VII large subunit [Desmospora profundinema]MDR6224647.1 exodeoxyribonuclease VII large subunit [Desmospora profundinema]
METRRHQSVTELIQHLGHVIDHDEWLSRVWVEGEISNFKHHARGHMYFTLKDDQTRIRAVMFAGHNRRLRFRPKDGDDVLVRGRVAVYERDGQVQLYVSSMQPKGIGDRFLAFQELKEKLEAEGLFSPLFKQSLPFLPRRVGVITSAQGAAVRDIITTIRRRSPVVDILLYPVSVQGEDAAPHIAAALDEMNRHGEVDVIIVGRGGGSLEELWAFNEEEVARAIHRSWIPVVSAVGHETDTTIADHVADVRAATPTAAAELVVPRHDELCLRIKTLLQRLERTQRRQLEAARSDWTRMVRRRVLQRPGAQLERFEQRLDGLTDDLIRSIGSRFPQWRHGLKHRRTLLFSHHPADRLPFLRNRLDQCTLEGRRRIETRLTAARNRWLRRVDRLDAISPLKVMGRGYSLVFRHGDGELVKSARRVEAGDLIQVRLADGRLKCQVWGKEEWIDDGKTSGSATSLRRSDEKAGRGGGTSGER